MSIVTKLKRVVAEQVAEWEAELVRVQTEQAQAQARASALAGKAARLSDDIAEARTELGALRVRELSPAQREPSP